MTKLVTPERSVTLNRRSDVTDPDDRFAWYDENGLRDLTGWTLALEVIDPATNTIRYTKTSGVVGGDGTEPTNLIIAWETAEMEPLVGLKRWEGRAVATRGDELAEFVLDSVGTFPVWVFAAPAITAEP